MRKRATRFPVQIPIWYREVNETGSYEGRIENMSHSGVLFRTGHLLSLSAPVEMNFVLPVVLSNEPPAEIVCRGSVVRTVPPSAEEGLPGLAIAISDYQFMRKASSGVRPSHG
jgi:PilZ domain